jgi:hypothetical protein
MMDKEKCLRSRMQLFIFFSVRLSKKYIGQLTYRVGNPVSYQPFIAQFCVTYYTIVRYLFFTFRRYWINTVEYDK